MVFSQTIVLFTSTIETNSPVGLFEAVKIPFVISLNPDQKVRFSRIFAQVIKRDGGAPTAKAEVFFNNAKKGEKFWDINDLIENEPFVLDRQISNSNLRINEPNEVIVEVEQGIVGASTIFDVYVDFYYELEDDRPPPEDPVIDVPEREEEDPFSFPEIDLVKVGAGVAVIGGVLLFASGFGKGLGRSVGSR